MNFYTKLSDYNRFSYVSIPTASDRQVARYKLLTKSYQLKNKVLILGILMNKINDRSFLKN